MRQSNNAVRALALGLVLTALGGCSQTNEYLDRRDTIALNGGDAVAANKITQIVDPWPPASADRHIGFNGERMESAMERYRTNRTYPTQSVGTSSAYQQQPQQQQPQQQQTNNATPLGPTVTQPAAPVK